jgi:hypothetical protein
MALLHKKADRLAWWVLITTPIRGINHEKFVNLWLEFSYRSLSFYFFSFEFDILRRRW